MKFYSYCEWRELQKKLFSKSHKAVDCYNCGGSGEVECDCCGHESDCDECDSTGVLWESDNGDIVASPSFTIRDYRKSVLKELVRMQRITRRSYYKQARHFLQQLEIGELL